MSEAYVWRLYHTAVTGLWEFEDFSSREDRAEHLVEFLDDYDSFVLRDGFPWNLYDEPDIIPGFTRR